MEFGSNVLLPADSVDTAVTEAELQYNSAKAKVGFHDGTGVVDIATNQELASTDNAKGASLIGLEAIAGLASTDVQGGIEELKSITDGLTGQQEVLEEVQFNINYVQTTTGAPGSSSGLTIGERLLNTFDGIYYTATSATAWDGGTAVGTNRFIFKDSGSGTVAGATATADSNIYDGDDIDAPYVPDYGDRVPVQDEGTNGLLYFKTTTVWTPIGNLANHNDFLGIQGGQAGEYNHLNNFYEALVTSLDSTVNGEGISQIGIEAITGLVATNGQAALAELQSTKSEVREFQTTITKNVATDFVHNLNNRHVAVTVRKDDGGAPGEEVIIKNFPKSGSELTTIQLLSNKTYTNAHVIIEGLDKN